jgi:ABC-type multidrug transport system ATPase subunit
VSESPDREREREQRPRTAGEATEDGTDRDGPDPGETVERGDAAAGSPVARVDGVGHAFGDVSVLEDVSFAVPSGGVTALVGPNGSGKTTLLRIAGGLLEPSSGSVDAAAGDARGVGYLPQSPAFRPIFTVRETVAHYAALLGAGEPVDVDAALERVGMAAAADRRVDALSGGMVRLLGIAVAVLGDPPLVLFDEPTGDLDPLMTEHVFSVIDDLAADGMGVLLATHDLTGAAGADRVLLLADGTVAAAGAPDDLLAERGVESLPDLFRSVVGEGRLSVSVGGDEP